MQQYHNKRGNNGWQPLTRGTIVGDSRTSKMHSNNSKRRSKTQLSHINYNTMAGERQPAYKSYGVAHCFRTSVIGMLFRVFHSLSIISGIPSACSAPALAPKFPSSASSSFSMLFAASSMDLLTPTARRKQLASGFTTTTKTAQRNAAYRY